MIGELDRLIRWYAAAWQAEADGIDRLHEPHPGPDDLTGAPEWTSQFRSFLYAKADAIDEEGWYRRPLRAALMAVAYNDADHYQLLTRLRSEWDIEDAAGYGPDASDRMLGALRNLRRLYQERAA